MQASPDRLDRIEALVESNARSIQALGDRIAELTHVQTEASDERQELRQATLRIVNRLASLREERQ